jgi:transcriptional antiterminator RfaH
MMEWFCAMSEPRREMVAEEALRELDVADVYLPRYTRSVVRSRRVVERVEPLFPGYLFVLVDRARQSLYDLRKADGLRRFVTMGGEPLRVPPNAVARLRTAETLCQLADTVKPLFSPEQPVHVATMPNTEIARIIRAGPRDRWLIAMRWFGVERELLVEACNLEPA